MENRPLEQEMSGVAVERNIEILNDKNMEEEIRALKTGAMVEYNDIKEQLKKI